jgi:hypothetical protein
MGQYAQNIRVAPGLEAMVHSSSELPPASPGRVASRRRSFRCVCVYCERGGGVDPRALGDGVPQEEQKRTFADSSTPQDEQYPITFVCNSLLQTPCVRPPTHYVFLASIENRLPAFATETNPRVRVPLYWFRSPHSRLFDPHARTVIPATIKYPAATREPYRPSRYPAQPLPS